MRPAPVPDFNARRRSFALEEFDPFWQKVVEADVVVGMHASDSGFQRYVNEWEGHDGEFLPFNQKLSAFYHLLHAENRMINDVVTSRIARTQGTSTVDSMPENECAGPTAAMRNTGAAPTRAPQRAPPGAPASWSHS